MAERQAPACFVSYSWDDDIHKGWVRRLAADLQANGIAVILDQWELQAGDDAAAFMDSAIHQCRSVLLVCTPAFKSKADTRAGNVGYETSVITGEMLTGINHPRKFIPILRSGDPATALPSYLASKIYVDFRDNHRYHQKLIEVLRVLHSKPEYSRNLLGPSPFSARGSIVEVGSAISEALFTTPQPSKANFEIEFYWGYRPHAHSDLRQAILSCESELFVSGVTLTTVSQVLNDPEVTDYIANRISADYRFRPILVMLEDATHPRSRERGGQQLGEKLRISRGALSEFNFALENRVRGDIPRPLVDFRVYGENTDPRHFFLKVDDIIYVGSYLSHQRGSYSYLMKIRNLGDRLYELFNAEIDHILGDSRPISLDT